MRFSVRKFNRLSLNQLYNILKLRFAVFVVEQKSIYAEFDDIDQKALHVFLEKDRQIVAYARIYRKSSKKASLARVAVHKRYRDKGLGSKIIAQCIQVIKTELKSKVIETSAQDYLKKFYENFGFRQISKPYDDGGVTHIDMIKE